jgi:mRNA-degrading endonuclease toxin of MazEF toxin-antitoxin module
VSFEPKPGLVVRYDYLWKEEQQIGIEDGKHRPCAIVMTFAERPDGTRDVLLCAITHSPPGGNETCVEIPPAVAKHLGLDHEQSWIKTDQVNRLTWKKDRIPHGIVQARNGEWSFGMIPHRLGEQVFEQVREKARSRTIKTVDRHEIEPPTTTSKDLTAKPPTKRGR